MATGGQGTQFPTSLTTRTKEILAFADDAKGATGTLGV